MADAHRPPPDRPSTLCRQGEALTHPHDSDPSGHAPGVSEAYRRLADEIAQQLDDLLARTETLTRRWHAGDQRLAGPAGPLQGWGATCDACGATKLEHFYTSHIGGKTLCEGCFEKKKREKGP